MVSRRSILRGATGLAAAAPLAVTLDAFAADPVRRPGAAPDVPDTLAKRRTRLADGARVSEAEFPLTHLALSWTGPAAAVRLRTRSGWGPWRDAHGCVGARDGASTRSTILAAPGAVGYEVRVSGGGTARALELNTVDGPRRRRAAAAGSLPLAGSAQALPRVGSALSWAGSAQSRPGAAQPLGGILPEYLSRSAWGADEKYRFDANGNVITPPAYFPVQTLTVHHSGFDDDETDPRATVRAIYYNQAVGEGWGDIGYQLLIDAEGRVYEGAYSDSDAVPVFGPELGADGRPQMVNGAHVGGFNAGNVGVCLLGNFNDRLPTPAARHTLKIVLAVLAGACRLNPTGTTAYVNPLNAKKATVATICGHRDWHAANDDADPTDCPGHAFYPQLPALRREVADLLRLLPPVNPLG